MKVISAPRHRRRRMIEIMVELQRFRKRGTLHARLLRNGLYTMAHATWRKESRAYNATVKVIASNLFNGDEQRGPGGLKELVGKLH